VYKFQGDYSRAKDMFSEIKEDASPDLAPFASYQAADCLYRMGKRDEAIALMKEAFAKDFTSEVNQIAQLRVGYIYLYDIGDIAKAYEEFGRLQSLAVESNGFIYLMEAGKKIFKGFMKPTELAAYSKLNAFVNKNNVPAVAKKFRDIGFQALIEGYTLLRHNNSSAAVVQFKDALQNFNLALKFNSSDAFSHSGKGLASFYLNDKEEAIREAKMAKELLPRSPAILANLAFVYYHLGMLDEAIVEYKKAALLSPDSSFLLYNLGTIYIFKNELVKAITYLTQAIRFNPRFPYPYNNLGYLLWLKGAYKEAKINLEKAISLKPDYVDAHYNLAVLLFTLGEYRQAREEFLRVEALQPSYKQTANYLKEIKESLRL
jgi:tetratricopeptide (TPR) repeat protein